MASGLIEKNFLLLWQGHLVSAIGTQLFNVALMYWVLETTESATTMGFVMTASLLPTTVFSLFAGALADRMSRKALIVGADVIRGIACISFSTAILVLGPSASVGMLFGYVIIAGVASSFFGPALRAALPEVVGKDNLLRANSLLQGASSFAATVGAAIGGFLYLLLGAPMLFLANGVSFLLSAASEAFVTVPRPAERAPTSILTDVHEGLKFIMGNRGLRRLLVTIACMNLTSAPLIVTLPMLVRDHHQSGPDFLGLLAASQSIGTLLAAAALGSRAVPARLRPVLAPASLALCAASLIGMIYLEERFLVACAFALYGIGLVGFNVPIQAAIQSNTPAALRGRVPAASTTIVGALLPLAAAVTGVIVDAVDKNVSMVWIGTAAVFCGCAASIMASRPARTYLTT